jgi:sec-independent protein translocase protein TatB
MFGLSWAQIGIIVLAGAFVLGPERIPTAVTFVTGNLKKVRSMAAGAQSELRREIGPELDELRRQVDDLRSITQTQGFRDLQDLNPRRLLSKNVLGEDFSGGITGFLGLKADPPKLFSLGGLPGNTPAPMAPAQASVNGESGDQAVVNGPVKQVSGTDSAAPPHLPPSMLKTLPGASDPLPEPCRRAPVVAGRLPPFDSEGT